MTVFFQYFRKQDKNQNIGILFLLILFMTTVTGICSRNNVWELLVFLGFQFFCILLPGAAVMALFPIKNLTKTEKTLLTYISGYMVTIIAYVALMITIGNVYVRIGFVLLPVMACVVLAFIRKKDDRLMETTTEGEGDALWIATVLVVFLVSLIAFTLRWKIPYAAGANDYDADFLYWAGDIVALKKQFPPKEFRTLNPIYRYHYFGALQQAAVSTVTGIQAIKTAVCYSNIEATIILGLSSYALVERMIKNKAVRILTLILMLFSTGLEETATLPYMRDMYQVPMSYNIAHGLGITVVVLLLIQMKNNRLDVCNLIWSICCLLCCTGTKSLAGAVILCGVAAVYGYLLFSRGSRRATIIAIILFILVFGAAGIYLWPTARYANITMKLPDIQMGSGSQILYSLRVCMVWLGKYGLKTAAANFWVFIPAGLYSVSLLIRKKMKMEHLLFATLIIAGTMGNYLFQFHVNSQMYFTVAVVPFAAVLTGLFLEDLFQGHIPQKVQCFIVAFLGIMIAVFTLYNDTGRFFGRNLVLGIKNAGVPRPGGDDTGFCLIGVSQAECEAYCWILENTDEDVILLSGRSLENIHDPTTVFSERYAYVPHDYLGGDYLRVRGCFMGDQEAVRYYAELGLDYIVQRKFHTPLLQCPADVGEVAFENDEVRIYRLFWGQKGKNGILY